MKQIASLWKCNKKAMESNIKTIETAMTNTSKTNERSNEKGTEKPCKGKTHYNVKKQYRTTKQQNGKNSTTVMTTTINQ